MMEIKALPPTGPIQEPWRALNEPAQIIQALQRQRDQLLEALEELLAETTWITRETSEWANSCAACDAIADDPDTHAPDCALVQARAAVAAARAVD